MKMRSALFRDFTQRRMAVYHRRFGTTYRCHLQGSSSSWNALPIKMGQTVSHFVTFRCFLQWGFVRPLSNP